MMWQLFAVGSWQNIETFDLAILISITVISKIRGVPFEIKNMNKNNASTDKYGEGLRVRFERAVVIELKVLVMKSWDCGETYGLYKGRNEYQNKSRGT